MLVSYHDHNYYYLVCHHYRVNDYVEQKEQHRTVKWMLLPA